MAERLYAKSGDAGAAGPSSPTPARAAAAHDDVVDAEFEEVKDDKR
jgi:molecular chaperone DnaK